jgi:HK97 family phage major capsid protein
MDSTGRFLLPQTPGQNAARTLWNTPVTLSSGVPAKTAVVGDLRTVVVPVRSGMQLTWSEETVNAGTQASPVSNDSFRKNQLVFRAEVRMGISVLSAPSLRKATLA